MRVTGGELKGRQLLPGFANHVRPSTDRVRESLFNSLQNQIDLSNSKVLDLFSGSGIIALEFLSRNTNSVISVDLDKKNISYQKNIRQEWKITHQKINHNPTPTEDVNASITCTNASAETIGNWEIIMADVWKFIPKVKETFDIIFADPPYHMPNVQQLPSLLLPLLNLQNPDAVILFEHKPQLQFPSANTPQYVKDYGSSIISFFKT